MPLKNKNHPPLCINHPDEAMVRVRSKKEPDSINVLLTAKISQDNPKTYAPISEAIGLNLFACKKCGYCELYLLDHEAEEIQELD